MFHSKRFSFTRGERCEKNDQSFHNGFLRIPNFMMSRVSGVLDVFWLLLKKSNLWFRHQKSIDMQSDWIAKHLSPNLILHHEKIGNLELDLYFQVSSAAVAPGCVGAVSTWQSRRTLQCMRCGPFSRLGSGKDWQSAFEMVVQCTSTIKLEKTCFLKFMMAYEWSNIRYMKHMGMGYRMFLDLLQWCQPNFLTATRRPGLRNLFSGPLAT